LIGLINLDFLAVGQIPIDEEPLVEDVSNQFQFSLAVEKAEGPFAIVIAAIRKRALAFSRVFVVSELALVMLLLIVGFFGPLAVLEVVFPVSLVNIPVFVS
jgi:hypothetical protein